MKVLMNKQVILTGLRANNDLHIGHVFGAMLPIIDVAKKRAGEYQVNMFIPDLHSFTTPIDHSKLQEQIMHNLKIFVACGLPLNNPDVHIYRQSYIPAHSELTVLLNNFTGMGEMERMTQFKDKSRKLKMENSNIYNSVMHGEYDTPEFSVRSNNARDQIRNRISVGLFDYPVLMASDILLYGAEYVPVGDDQSQHLEITRDLGQRINTKFLQDIFRLPKPVKDQHAFFGKDRGLRIMDLVDPTKKMSKSDENGKGVIFLGDSPELVSKKVMSATTDSIGVINYDKENQPGITNLLDLLALITQQDLKAIIDEYKGQTQYGQLKKTVAEAVRLFITDFQTKLASVDEQAIIDKLEVSEELMNRQANQTLQKVQKAIGLR